MLEHSPQKILASEGKASTLTSTSPAGTAPPVRIRRGRGVRTRVGGLGYFALFRIGAGHGSLATAARATTQCDSGPGLVLLALKLAWS